MAQEKISMMARRLHGGFAHFTEEGTEFVIPGDTPTTITISAAVAPDFEDKLADQPSLGCIEQVAFSAESEDQTFYCPKETGGYERHIERNVTADFIDLTATMDMELVQRLELGVPQKIEEGDDQVPFSQSDRKIRGWLYLLGRKQNGQPLLKLTLWCELRLQENPAWSREPGRPVLRAQAVANSLNEVVWPEEEED